MLLSIKMAFKLMIGAVLIATNEKFCFEVNKQHCFAEAECTPFAFIAYAFENGAL